MTSHRRALLILLLIFVWNSGVPIAQESSANTVELRVSPDVLVSGVQRAGLNLGGWSSWGAEQLGSNIIHNPGFEGIVDGALATVQMAQGRRLSLGRDATYRGSGFWKGAYLTFRTGKSAGKQVRVVEFEKDASSRQETVLTEFEVAASPGDIVALARSDDESTPTQWWFGANSANCLPGPPRPGSPGKRSVTLCPVGAQPAELNSFLDTITDRAGKLLPIQGKWRFSFWSTSVKENAELRVSFGRDRSPAFFERRIHPSNAWHQTIIEFDAKDAGPDGALQLQFSVTGGSVRLDDVSLSRIADGDLPFRSEVVTTLERLRPGYLRDWQGQLGDSLSNRLAPAFARRASRYRSANSDDAHYEYSIPEFLALCHRVDASPWIILPTTFSDDESRQFGEYLRNAQHQFRFREILVEFGNENWNPLFSAAGIQDPARHGEAAERAFLQLRQGAGRSVPIRTVINAQYADPQHFENVARHAAADIVAFAPYFAYDLPAGATSAQADAILFASAKDSLHHLSSTASAHRQEVAVYEVNLHTVGGSAGKAERDRFALSPAAGSALAKRMIESMLSGVRSQCVYSLAGYDAFTSDGKGLVQLWGVARDLAAAPHLRFTGLAMELLNQAVQSEVHEVRSVQNSSDAGITAIAFRGTNGWSAAIVSSRPIQTMVNLQFPAASNATSPRTLVKLTDDSSDATTIATTTALRRSPVVTNVAANLHVIRVTVPARSMVVLLPASRDSSNGAQL